MPLSKPRRKRVKHFDVLGETHTLTFSCIDYLHLNPVCRGLVEHATATSGRAPDGTLRTVKKWKDVVGASGPAGLRLIKGFHDEALRGEWKGHRSSRLGIQYRVIYQVVAQEILVKVIDITAHDYRKN